MARKPKGKDLAKRKGTAPTTYDYGAQSGVGAEDITRDDFLVPFIRIIQTNSPQVAKKNEKYIEGAEAGMFFNTVTNQLYAGDPGFMFHLSAKVRAYAEFTPRDDGGGFVGQREPDDPDVVKLIKDQGRFGRLSTEAGTELVETYYAYGVIVTGVEGDEPQPVVLPLSSTGITPFKQFLSALNPLLRKGVPIFAARIRVSARYASNKEGDYYRWHLVFDGGTTTEYLAAPDDPIILVGAEFRESIATGLTRVDYSASQEDTPDPDAF